MRFRIVTTALVLIAAVAMASAAQAQEKPNIVVIWGDDIGQSNISAYTKGVMGYHLIYPFSL